jgi:Auxiliary Activity family 9 (formerly GH61)
MLTLLVSIAPGEYLIRVEHIALHQAAQVDGAQYYVSCGQVKVTGTGAGKPGPLVAFPGAYQPNDPGLKVNIYGSLVSNILCDFAVYL